LLEPDYTIPKPLWLTLSLDGLEHGLAANGQEAVRVAVLILARQPRLSPGHCLSVRLNDAAAGA
jgi:hypothetical protein